MKRKYGFVLGVSVTMGMLSLEPRVMAWGGPDLRDSDRAIHVQTYGGIVTLTGDVASPATAEHAQTVVAQVSGVRDVVNDLKYPHPSGGGDSGPRVVPPAAPAK
jgi:hypothetical protein